VQPPSENDIVRATRGGIEDQAFRVCQDESLVLPIVPKSQYLAEVGNKQVVIGTPLQTAPLIELICLRKKQAGLFELASRENGNGRITSSPNRGESSSIGGKISGSFAQTTLPAAVSSTVYNAANQLTGWAGTSPTNDLNGNLKTDGTNTYSWDLRNQLSAISGGSTASFQYDGLRRRLGKTINGTSTSFLYDYWNIIQELSGSTPTANLIGGLRPDEIFSRTDAAGTRVFLVDALGSTLALTDTTGSQTQYTYDPFSNTSVSGVTTTNSFQYTGRENDETGLYFNRARYYKPGFGRFVSEDPIGFNGGINLYGYATDNPINLVDPFGLQDQPNPAECWNQYIRDLQSCYDAYKKDPVALDNCYKAARARRDFCLGKTRGPTQ